VFSVYIVHYVKLCTVGGPQATPFGTLQPERQTISRRFVFVLCYLILAAGPGLWNSLPSHLRDEDLLYSGLGSH